MSHTLTLEVPETLQRDIERLATERGMSTADFILSAVAQRASAIEEAAAYFRARAAHAEPGAARSFFRDAAGDEPPRPGDELEG